MEEVTGGAEGAAGGDPALDLIEAVRRRDVSAVQRALHPLTEEDGVSPLLHTRTAITCSDMWVSQQKLSAYPPQLKLRVQNALAFAFEMDVDGWPIDDDADSGAAAPRTSSESGDETATDGHDGLERDAELARIRRMLLDESIDQLEAAVPDGESAEEFHSHVSSNHHRPATQVLYFAIARGSRNQALRALKVVTAVFGKAVSSMQLCGSATSLAGCGSSTTCDKLTSTTLLPMCLGSSALWTVKTPPVSSGFVGARVEVLTHAIECCPERFICARLPFLCRLAVAASVSNITNLPALNVLLRKASELSVAVAQPELTKDIVPRRCCALTLTSETIAADAAEEDGRCGTCDAVWATVDALAVASSEVLQMLPAFASALLAPPVRPAFGTTHSQPACSLLQRFSSLGGEESTAAEALLRRLCVAALHLPRRAPELGDPDDALAAAKRVVEVARPPRTRASNLEPTMLAVAREQTVSCEIVAPLPPLANSVEDERGRCERCDRRWEVVQLLRAWDPTSTTPTQMTELAFQWSSCHPCSMLRRLADMFGESHLVALTVGYGKWAVQAKTPADGRVLLSCVQELCDAVCRSIPDALAREVLAASATPVSACVLAADVHHCAARTSKEFGRAVSDIAAIVRGKRDNSPRLLGLQNWRKSASLQCDQCSRVLEVVRLLTGAGIAETNGLYRAGHAVLRSAGRGADTLPCGMLRAVVDDAKAACGREGHQIWPDLLTEVCGKPWGDRRSQPLTSAAQLVFVRELLDLGWSTAAVDAVGRTALHRAARNGLTDISLCLLKAGAPAAAVTTSSKATALHAAALAETPHCLLAMLEVLATPLRTGVINIDAPLSDQRTPLMLAAGKGSHAAIAALLRRGADPLLSYFQRDNKVWPVTLAARKACKGDRFAVRCTRLLVDACTNAQPTVGEDPNGPFALVAFEALRTAKQQSQSPECIASNMVLRLALWGGFPVSARHPQLGDLLADTRDGVVNLPSLSTHLDLRKEAARAQEAYESTGSRALAIHRFLTPVIAERFDSDGTTSWADGWVDDADDRRGERNTLIAHWSDERYRRRTSETRAEGTPHLRVWGQLPRAAFATCLQQLFQVNLHKKGDGRAVPPVDVARHTLFD